MRAGVIAIAAVALGLEPGRLRIGHQVRAIRVEAATSSEASTTETTRTSAAAPTTSAQAAGQNYTIVDYIRDNGIVETPVKRGDPGSPTIDLPFPPGWEDAGAEHPGMGLRRNHFH